MKKIKDRLEFALKHNPILYSIVAFFVNACFKFLGLFIPISDKRVLFTGHGRKYNDSPRVLYEYMISHPEYDDYELYWGLEEPERTNVPGRAKKIKTDTFRYFLFSMSCKYWITCVNIERGFRYKKKMHRFIRIPAPFDTKRGIQFNKFPLAKALISHKRQFNMIKINNNK